MFIYYNVILLFIYVLYLCLILSLCESLLLYFLKNVYKNHPASISVPLRTDRWRPPETPSSPPPLILRFLSWTLVFLFDKHCCLIIALLPYTPSCCCFIAFFSCRGFNKPLYLFVTTQTPLALTTAFFNFLTGYLLEGTRWWSWGGGVTETTESRLVASVSAAYWMTLCVCKHGSRSFNAFSLFFFDHFCFVWLWRS